MPQDSNASDLNVRVPSADIMPQLSRRISDGQLFWLLQCIGWAAYGAAMFVWGLDYFTPLDALLNKALLVATGFVLTLLLRLVYRGIRARLLSPLATAFLVLTVSFAGAVVWRETQQLLVMAADQLIAGQGMAPGLLTISLGTLMYDGFVLLAWSLLYFGIKDWMEIAKQRERAAKAEALAHVARLRALQSQLAPHFLFNTLNSISTLVVEGQTSSAIRMISRLSDFLRLTLDAHDTPEICVAEELEFVRNYLEIEQIRFGERLRVSIEVAPKAMSASVPALILQPLVENAVKHGVLPREQGGTVAISVTVKDGTLLLAVADSGLGFSNCGTLLAGTGLTNTRARLQELYRSDSTFTLDSPPGGGVVATITIPFRTAAKPSRNPMPQQVELPCVSS